MEYLKDRKRRLQQIISLPFLWSVIIPLVFFDIWVEVYHRICFPLYGLRYVKRSNYIRIDRHKLKYLKWYEKIGCAYCGYANGHAGYWTAIARRTEQYWCGVMHKKYAGFKAPEHHKSLYNMVMKKRFTSVTKISERNINDNTESMAYSIAGIVGSLAGYIYL